jgi:hypothetical protein
MTGGREIRRVIGQAEVNVMCAGREETREVFLYLNQIV